MNKLPAILYTLLIIVVFRYNSVRERRIAIHELTNWNIRLLELIKWWTDKAFQCLHLEYHHTLQLRVIIQLLQMDLSKTVKIV